MQLQVIESIDGGVFRFRSVEGESKEAVIDAFVEKFSTGHDPKSLKTLLKIHDEIRLGDQLFRFVLTDKELENA